MKSKKILITGGAGFIGSNLIRYILKHRPHQVVNLDKLTYAGNLGSLADVEQDPRYQFEQVDIVDFQKVTNLFREHKPDAVIHLAAESHVDRSIDAPAEFVQTNVVGTFNLLESARIYRESLAPEEQSEFRFHHVTTDEVYGSLDSDEKAFDETTPYDPHSPYAATKAASDHLARAWSATFGLPILISCSTNNYGPFQYPEKLIPHVILNAIHGRKIPIYGDGQNVRDWIFVEDHCEAIMAVLEQGQPGETYCVGGNNERTNLEVVQTICQILDRIHPLEQNELLKNADDDSSGEEISNYEDLIEFVVDRPGHDWRYATDTTRIKTELGWKPKHTADSGFETTVQWYLENAQWWNQILSGKYPFQRQGFPKPNPA